MTTDTTTAPESTRTEPHPCDVCPMRSITQDSSFGYCEGCPSRLRRCRSCEEFKPQTDWGWGFYGYVFVGYGWVCAGCRVRPTPDRVAEHSRFVAKLGLDERSATSLAHGLNGLADQNSFHPAAEVLHRVATSLEDGGDIDIDVSDFGLQDREALAKAVALLPSNVPSWAGSAAFQLQRAWGMFVEDSSPARPEPEPTPTVGQRVAALGLEQEVTPGG